MRGKRHLNSPTPSWESGKTTVIRVPIALKDELLAIARAMDDPSSSPISPITRSCQILEEALTLPANKGGAIKVKIREALALLNSNAHL